MCKVDTIVLPMPYNQLLKLNLLAWTFTLPFVIVEETGWFCPFCMFFIGAAFFGLDQVRANPTPTPTATPTPTPTPNSTH